MQFLLIFATWIYFRRIPNNTLLHYVYIFLYLPDADICRSLHTCKTIYKNIELEEFWKKLLAVNYAVTSIPPELVPSGPNGISNFNLNLILTFVVWKEAYAYYASRRWDPSKSSESLAFTSDRLSFVRTNTIENSHAMAKTARPFPAQGKFYWEVTITGRSYNRQVYIGLAELQARVQWNNCGYLNSYAVSKSTNGT